MKVAVAATRIIPQHVEPSLSMGGSSYSLLDRPTGARAQLPDRPGSCTRKGYIRRPSPPPLQSLVYYNVATCVVTRLRPIHVPRPSQASQTASARPSTPSTSALLHRPLRLVCSAPASSVLHAVHACQHPPSSSPSELRVSAPRELLT